MNHPRRSVGIAKIAAVAVAGALLVLAVGKATLGVGPSLPGPPIRVMMGLADPTLSTCEPDPPSVRRPGNRATIRRWQLLDPVAGTVDEMRAVVADDSLFLLGGLKIDRWGQRYNSLGMLFRYDPSSNTLALESRLPRRLDHVLAVGRGSSIYIVGGYEDGVPRAEVWRYDIGDRSWTALTPMRTPRGALGGGILDGKLYAVGGAHGYEKPQTRDGTPDAYASVEIYDFARNRWVPGQPMQTARHHFASVVAEGKLYVVGGRIPRDTSLAERLDPATGTWEPLPPLPLRAGSIAGTNVRGRVVVLGGDDENEGWVTPAVWTFDPRADRWRRLPDLAIARHSETAAAYRGYVYAFAGSPCVGYGIERRPERIRIDLLSRPAPTAPPVSAGSSPASG